MLTVVFERVTTDEQGVANRQGFPLKECELNEKVLCPDLDLINAVEGKQEFTNLEGKAFAPNSVAYLLRFDKCTLTQVCQ